MASALASPSWEDVKTTLLAGSSGAGRVLLGVVLGVPFHQNGFSPNRDSVARYSIPHNGRQRERGSRPCALRPPHCGAGRSRSAIFANSQLAFDADGIQDGEIEKAIVTALTEDDACHFLRPVPHHR